MNDRIMRKYPNISDIQNKVMSDGMVQLTFCAEELSDIIHPYSVPGYEYLSGGFTGFLDRFRAILPEHAPVVLEITGKQFSDSEKKMIDKAIWMHYGLNLSEASRDLKKIEWKITVYLILMVLSSSLMILTSHITNEIVTNYAAVLFWFFGYRVLTNLILEYQPNHKEYRWYRRLAALKLVFANDAQQPMDAEEVSRETNRYAKDADALVGKDRFVEQVLMEDTCVSLGCRVNAVEDVVFPSGAGDVEIVSDEMADYLMSALPFVRKKAITKLTIEGNTFTEEEQNRISAAFRNYMAFLISGQEAERRSNKGISILFAVGLLASTIILFICGKNVQLPVHEFIMVTFWFFADYLLEFVILSRKEIKDQKRILEKLAAMDILFA